MANIGKKYNVADLQVEARIAVRACQRYARQSRKLSHTYVCAYAGGLPPPRCNCLEFKKLRQFTEFNIKGGQGEKPCLFLFANRRAL